MNRFELELFERGGDAERVARCAQASRIDVIEALGGEVRDLVGPLCSVMAPLLTAFCEWVVDRCHERGIRHLFFMARDGQIFQKIIHRLTGERAGIRLHYLYVSRRSLQLPLLDMEAGVPAWMLDECRGIEDIARGLDCELGQLRAAVESSERLKDLEKTAFADQPKDERHAALAGLLADPGVGALVKAQASQARDRALRYLRERHFCALDQLAVVDIGWRGSQQAWLRQLAESGDLGIGAISGFYLFQVEHRHSGRDRAEGFLCTPDQPEACRTFYRYRQLIETAIGAPHASTKGYRIMFRAAEPVLEADPISDFRRADQQHQAILAFVDRYRLAFRSAGSVPSLPLRGLLVTNLLRFLREPERGDAQAFAGRTFVHCHMTGKHQSVIRSPRPQTLLFASSVDLGVWGEGTMAQFTWRQALAWRLRQHCGGWLRRSLSGLNEALARWSPALR